MTTHPRSKPSWLVLVLAASCCLTTAARALTLVANGEPRATIVLAAEPTEKAKLAANELQTYVQKMSGAKLQIVSEGDAPAGALVFVGPSGLAQQMGVAIPSGLTNARREEGFVMACAGDRLLLAGNDAGPYHGTEYAVYELLNRLGVRWFMPGEFGEVVPQKSTITVPDMQVREAPDFVMRNWWAHMKPELVEDERRWKIRNKMNPDSMFHTPGDSSARNILPEAQYFKDHPEYFAMNPDGSRNPYLPNLTSPEAVQVAAGIIKDHFAKNPDANSYGFAPDDGLPRDYNPETVKINQGFTDLLGRPGVPAEVSTTEEWIRFVNQVTAEVRKEYPDVYIATNGYANRNLPPEGVTPDDHLVIMFAAIWSCTIHAYDDPHCWQKVRQGQILKRWCELCKNVWIYNYLEQMLVSCLTPLPETRELRRDFPLLKEWGVMGFLDEARNVWMESGIASRYLRAKLEWNANADVDAILRDFYETWYGKASAPMQVFYESIEDAIELSPLHGHEDRILPYVYTDDLLSRLPGLLSEAEALADTETTKLHVHADRLIYEHLKAYMDMSKAEWAGDFAAAARYAQKMMDIRGELYKISPFFVWYDEGRYHSGVWYWAALDRKAYYESLDDLISGKKGDLVAMLPEETAFRTDPFDDGIAEKWYAPDYPDTGWDLTYVTRPFYIQGYQDAAGHPYVGNMWYRFRVDVPAAFAGRKIMLYAPVVETEAWCWVNGQYIGHRPYQEAYIRPNQMELDITGALKPGDTNVIAIRVSTGLCLSQAASGLLGRVFLYAPK